MAKVELKRGGLKLLGGSVSSEWARAAHEKERVLQRNSRRTGQSYLGRDGDSSRDSWEATPTVGAPMSSPDEGEKRDQRLGLA